MSEGVQTIIYPVKDLEKAKSLFRAALGVDPYVDAPYYVGFRVGSSEVGLDPNGHSQGMTGPVPYCEVADIRKTLQSLLEAGAEAVQDVKDVGGGRLIAYIKDADGNMIGLMHTP